MSDYFEELFYAVKNGLIVQGYHHPITCKEPLCDKCNVLMVDRFEGLPERIQHMFETISRGDICKCYGQDVVFIECNLETAKMVIRDMSGNRFEVNVWELEERDG